MVSILQPHYLPYLGYFSMMEKSDIFIFLDDVYYIKREWKNRNKIRMENNTERTRFLSVPIKKMQRSRNLNLTEISYETDWMDKHLNFVKVTYKKSPYLKCIIEILDEVFSIKPKYLSDLNIKLIIIIKNFLQINTQISKSSLFECSLKKTDKIIYLLNQVDASIYYANTKSKNYLDETKFKKNNIDLQYQNFIHPTYEQQKNVFVPFLSIIDCIAYYGKDSRKFLNV